MELGGCQNKNTVCINLEQTHNYVFFDNIILNYATILILIKELIYFKLLYKKISPCIVLLLLFSFFRIEHPVCDVIFELVPSK